MEGKESSGGKRGREARGEERGVTVSLSCRLINLIPRRGKRKGKRRDRGEGKGGGRKEEKERNRKARRIRRKE